MVDRLLHALNALATAPLAHTANDARQAAADDDAGPHSRNGMEEMVREFSDALLIVSDCPQVQLTRMQRDALEELESQVLGMERRGVLAGDDASGRAEWREARRLAAHALRALGQPVTGWPLACPVCNAGLTHAGRVFVCPAGHAFDQSRDGYVNLLVQQHRERGIDGDTRDMLRARRSFLEAGYYGPLLDRIVSLVDARLDDAAPGAGRACVAEVGCGEGYYIGGIAARARAGGRLSCVGLDVSRDAVRLAARKYADVVFAVANVRRRVYLVDGSASVLLSVFAPRNAAEFTRVTAPGGSVIIVIPAEDHLASLRGDLGLMGIQESKEDRVLEQFEGAFTTTDRSTLTYPLDLTAEAVRDLIAMGPNRWHADAGGRSAAVPANTTASFVILLLTKRQ